MAKEMFDPKKFGRIIEQLKKEGRLPSQKDWLRTMEEMRQTYRGRILAARKKERKQ